MKRVVIFAALLALVFVSARFSTAVSQPDEVAVIVNGEPIHIWELGLLMPQIQTEMASQGVDISSRDVLNMTLQRAVDSLLLAQEATRLGLKPDEERVKEKMDKVAAEAGGRAALEAELITSGVTYDQLRSTVVRSDLVQSLVEFEIVGGIHVTEKDVQTYYTDNLELFKAPDKIHTRHILFMVDSDADLNQREAARQKAVIAHARAVSGEDFATLAAELSEGPNAAKGGDLGFTARGQMIGAFDDAVWTLEPGEISEVVETPVGYHVIKVEEIAVGPVVPLDEARPTVTNFLRQQRLAAALASFVAELREIAEIREPEE